MQGIFSIVHRLHPAIYSSGQGISCAPAFGAGIRRSSAERLQKEGLLGGHSCYLLYFVAISRAQQMHLNTSLMQRMCSQMLSREYL